MRILETAGFLRGASLVNLPFRECSKAGGQAGFEIDGLLRILLPFNTNLTKLNYSTNL